jgi:glutaredoxin-related protein
MKGTPEAPQCGFSRASIQILGLEGVDPAKFAAFNVLEDDTLRQGIYHSPSPTSNSNKGLQKRIRRIENG